MESSRPEAESNLRNNLALQALAKEENIQVDKKVLENKIKEISKELSNKKNIDPQKLRQVVQDDLLQEQLFEWLEQNNTVVDNNPDKKKTTKKTTKTKSKPDKNTTDSPEK